MGKGQDAPFAAAVDPLVDFPFAALRVVFFGGFRNTGAWSVENRRAAVRAARCNRDTGFRVAQTSLPVQRVDG